MKSQMRFDRLARPVDSGGVALPRAARWRRGDVIEYPGPARFGKSFLVLAGAAVMLLGCQDQGGRGPEGLGPSAVPQQSRQTDDTSPSGGSSDARDPAGAGGETTGGETGNDTGGTGIAPSTTGAAPTGTSSTGTTGAGTSGTESSTGSSDTGSSGGGTGGGSSGGGGGGAS